jgi:hypothetical protein
MVLFTLVLRTNPTRTLRRTISAFSARARAVPRACSDLLSEPGTDRGRRDRLMRRVQACQSRLAEAALMVEAWSAEPGALPAEQSGPALRRRLIDAQQVVDRLATVSAPLSQGDPALAAAAARIADQLGARDYPAAERDARALSETAEQNAWLPIRQRQRGWLQARQFAVSTLELVTVANQITSLEASDTEPDRELLDVYEPVVGLANGDLPGSPTVAEGVPARGTRWNPLARLDLTSRQALQVGIAATLAIVFGRELSPERYYWAVLAAFLMFAGTTTRAEITLKGFNRVAGTLVGLFASVGFADLTARHTWAVPVVIVGCVFFGFYLMRLSYGYMIFFVTILVGQLYSVMHEFSTGLLVLRLEETAIGAACGFVVSFLVVPLSARDTYRTARDNLLAALADLLHGAADRLAGVQGVHLDALTRTLEDRMRQLTVVAKPLTRPLWGGSGSARTRHRLALYAATTTHARTLSVALRQPATDHPEVLATACRALATACVQITGVSMGRPQPAVGEPLRQADILLYSHAPAAPGARDTDPLIRTLFHLRNLLQSIAIVPTAEQQEPVPPTPGGENADMAGTITDASGEPIHGRVVLITEVPAQHQAATAYSDAVGHYQIAGCAPGNYLAVATAVGHQPVATRVTLRAGQSTTTDFEVSGPQPAADTRLPGRWQHSAYAQVPLTANQTVDLVLGAD